MDSNNFFEGKNMHYFYNNQAVSREHLIHGVKVGDRDGPIYLASFPVSSSQTLYSILEGGHFLTNTCK